MPAKKVDPRLVWTVSILLALLFAGLGTLFILRPEQAAKQPAGSEQAGLLLLLRGVGGVLCLGAVLLLVPRTTWLGALVLGAILLGMIVVSVVQGAASQAVVPALFVISVATLAYIRWPGRANAAESVPSTAITPVHKEAEPPSV